MFIREKSGLNREDTTPKASAIPDPRRTNKPLLEGGVWDKRKVMFEAAANEFPFVEALPKREKGRVAKILDAAREFSAFQKQHGSLYPGSLVYRILGISRQRFYELIETKQLEAHQFHGQWYVTETTFEEFCKRERKAGRPPKFPKTNRELWNISKEAAGLSKDTSK